MRTLGVTKLMAAGTVAALLGGGAAFVSTTAAKSHTPAKPHTATKIGSKHLVRIQVLSTRADLVSGGEALTQIVLPRGAKASKLRITLNNRRLATHQFAIRENGKLEGLLTGLRLGANTLTARLPSGYGARLKITNHPIGGPVFSGPQIQPWLCQSGATDKQCDQAPAIAYYYVPAGASSNGSNTFGSSSGSFVPYDPSHPPPSSSIATTTTTDGVTVPFIIRQETGYIDRDQYAIATLWQPGKPWRPWSPQPQFNHRLRDHPRIQL